MVAYRLKLGRRKTATAVQQMVRYDVFSDISDVSRIYKVRLFPIGQTELRRNRKRKHCHGSAVADTCIECFRRKDDVLGNLNQVHGFFEVLVEGHGDFVSVVERILQTKDLECLDPPAFRSEEHTSELQ